MRKEGGRGVKERMGERDKERMGERDKERIEEEVEEIMGGGRDGERDGDWWICVC